MAEPDYRSYAGAGMGALHRWYEPSTGHRRGILAHVRCLNPAGLEVLVMV